MRKLKLKTYQLQSRKRELEFFLSNFYNNDFVSENDVTIGKDTNQEESLEKLKQENLEEKIKILENEISKNCLEILEKIKNSTLKEVGELVLSQRGKEKDSEDVNFFIDNLFKPLDKLLDKLEKNELEKNVNFLIAIYYIIQDFIHLTKELSIIKLYGKKSTNVIIKSLNKVIAKNKDKNNVKEQIISLFSLKDKNFNKLDEIENNQKREIIELAEKMLNSEVMINDGMLRKLDKQEYKLDKISIIENVKEQIDFHIKQSQTVTFEDIKNHTINSIVFYYKDYYNIRIAKENLNKLKDKDMDFILLIRDLKLHRKKLHSKEKRYLFNGKLNEDDFKILEPYLIFDNFTILDYSTKSFLNRKLMTFFDNPENQSGEFKRVKEDLIK